MFKHILCPVDFSEASDHAIKYAIALAHLHRANLTALHVCGPALTTPVLPPAGGGSQSVDESRLLGTEVAALFEDATRRGLRVEVVIGRGQPAREILARAATLSADVIVMGTHGAGGFEHLVLGSVAEKVVRKAACPVFTVPPQAKFDREAPFKTLVCAVDFSDWSLAALEAACGIAGESGGTVTALHVIEWPWAEPEKADMKGIPPAQAEALLEYRLYQETMARSRLEATVKDVARERCPVVAQVLHGKPYTELLCTVEREHADLIVMGVHGRTALDVFFFGSTTHQVVRRAPCPVLTLRR
jgi:nucleotide-binding universal stress UspA family protein